MRFRGEENAMAIVLEPKSSYNLISRTESSNTRLLVHVKLTDSCLRALEEHQLAEVWFDGSIFLASMAILFCYMERKASFCDISLTVSLLIGFIGPCLLCFNRSLQGGNLPLDFRDFKG